MGENVSTFYFIGKLHPWEACVNFNPGEVHLGNGWVFELITDGTAIWIPGTDRKFNELRSEVQEAFEIIITTFVLITNKKLSFTLQNWVEAVDIVSKKNWIGFILPPGSSASKANPKSRVNVVWRRVGKAYIKIKNSFYHKLALRDFRNCIESRGDDSFFYAFRIVEDVRHAVTSHLPEGKTRDFYWQEMHKILGTSKQAIEPLTEVAEKVRHGDLNNKVVIEARKNREAILNIAYSILRDEFKRSFKILRIK